MLIAGAGLLVASPALAGAEDSATIVRLTPEERAAALDSATEASTDAALAQAAGGGGDRQVHGEIGAMIGTGGTRGIFGTAAIPLGDRGGAIISFEKSRFGGWR